MSTYRPEVYRKKYRPAYGADRRHHEPCRSCVHGKHDQCEGGSCYCRQVNHPEVKPEELAGVCC